MITGGKGGKVPGEEKNHKTIKSYKIEQRSPNPFVLLTKDFESSEVTTVSTT